MSLHEDRMAIGCGSASNHDRVATAVELATSGVVDFMSFDCLSERSIAVNQVRRFQDPQSGQDTRIRAFIAGLAPFLKREGRIVGNFGGANVEAGTEEIIDTLKGLHMTGVHVGVVHGDDILSLVKKQDLELPEMNCRVSDVADQVVSANAYIGAAPIVEALEQDAQIVIGGRIADPSLFVGPICHEKGWALDDWEKVALATVAGHLLECGVHSTGGNFADPPMRIVHDLDRLGFPVALVGDEDVIFTKTPGSGGLISEMTAKTQLGYEIHDPANYLTPDVTADISNVGVEQIGEDQVRVFGAAGRPRPEQLKVMVGLYLGWRAIGEISYAGPGCVDRAELAAEVVRKLLEKVGGITEYRCDLHGYNAIFGRSPVSGPPSEVRLRVAARCESREAADAVLFEVEYMFFGPAGAAGFLGNVVEQIGVTPAFVTREDVPLSVDILVS